MWSSRVVGHQVINDVGTELCFDPHVHGLHQPS